MRELSAPARRGGASGGRQESTLVKELGASIYARLGSPGEPGSPPLSAGVEPLLDKVRSVRLELFPEEGEVPPPPRKRTAVREELTKTLDETEDVLEALLLAVPGGSPSDGGTEG
jgi:hypothetical protein